MPVRKVYQFFFSQFILLCVIHQYLLMEPLWKTGSTLPEKVTDSMAEGVNLKQSAAHISGGGIGDAFQGTGEAEKLAAHVLPSQLNDFECLYLFPSSSRL